MILLTCMQVQCIQSSKIRQQIFKDVFPDLLFSTLKIVLNIQPGEGSCLDGWLHKNFSFNVPNFVVLMYGFLLTTCRFAILLTLGQYLSPFWAQYFRKSRFHIRV